MTKNELKRSLDNSLKRNEDYGQRIRDLEDKSKEKEPICYFENFVNSLIILKESIKLYGKEELTTGITNTIDECSKYYNLCYKYKERSFGGNLFRLSYLVGKLAYNLQNYDSDGNILINNIIETYSKYISLLEGINTTVRYTICRYPNGINDILKNISIALKGNADNDDVVIYKKETDNEYIKKVVSDLIWLINENSVTTTAIYYHKMIIDSTILYYHSYNNSNDLTDLLNNLLENIERCYL